MKITADFEIKSIIIFKKMKKKKSNKFCIIFRCLILGSCQGKYTLHQELQNCCRSQSLYCAFDKHQKITLHFSIVFSANKPPTKHIQGFRGILLLYVLINFQTCNLVRFKFRITPSLLNLHPHLFTNNSWHVDDPTC